jgi:hypothetical protein
MRAISTIAARVRVEPILQRRAADVFHHQIRQGDVAGGNQTRYVRAARRGENLPLDLEADKVLGAVRGCHARHFHHQRKVGSLRGIGVMHAVDACHATGVDARVDYEVVDLMTRFKQRRHETIPDNRNGRDRSPGRK